MPPPLDDKKLKISKERIERAWEDLRKHVLMGPLVHRARLKIIDYQPQVPAMFTTVGSSGEVFANPFNFPRTVGEWTFVLAHSLLHLAFGHVKKASRGIVWNIACDCVVNAFLERMRIGTAPEGLLRLPGGVPNDEEKLFQMWTQNRTPPKGETTNGTAMDMSAGGPGKAKWEDIFARAIRRAAKEALAAGAGDDADLRPTQQARAWFVRNYPLFGAVLQHLKIKEDARLCERLGVRIAAVNPLRRELHFNPGWALEDPEIRYLLAHMALHAALQHVSRGGDRDHFLWNAACDYCIDGWLAQMPQLLKHCKPPGEGLLRNPEFDNKTPEEVYDELQRNPKNSRKLVTFAGEAATDLLGWPEAGETSTARQTHDRILLDAMLRGLQIHTESHKETLPRGLVEELRRLENPPLPWDVQLARWFDEHVPPAERVRTYARPSRRQSSTPEIARPRYVWPEDEEAQRSSLAVVADVSGKLPQNLLKLALSAIATYALSRNLRSVRFIAAGAEVFDKGDLSPDDAVEHIALSPRQLPLIQPALDQLEATRDLGEEIPVLIVTGVPCDRIATTREHAFLIPENSRLPFRTDTPVIGIGE